ncbi:MAG: hypothetical protein IJ026_05650 [Candidatus Methanomethylophilaceae archaeon]|nr:hypothetical protein [Candidatus Methanomethylophilaceae archaeon]
MFHRECDIVNRDGAKAHLVHEHFSSPMEMCDVVSERRIRTPRMDFGFIQGTRTNTKPSFYGRSWRSRDTLIRNLSEGGKVPELERSVQDFAENIVCQIEHEVIQRHDVCGQRVSMGRYLSGSHKCMVRSKSVRSPSRSVHVVVDCAIWAGTTLEQYRLCAEEVIKAILILRAKGYTVALSAADTAYLAGCEQVVLTTVEVLGSSEPFNANRVTIPFVDGSFCRASMFSHVCSVPSERDVSSESTIYLGRRFFGNDAEVKSFLREQVDGEVVVISMEELAKTLRKDNAEVVRTRLVRDMEGEVA